ncbi:MAG: phosphatidylserine decarboxylase, partial [Nitrospinae bacterium]|nr:phosphatidylserine decarboxylase [Nitrospinota bacterium]
MKIPLASDGYRFIIPLFIVTVALVLMSQPWWAGVSGLALLFVLNFFRDPERAIPQEPQVVVSPGDGKVVEIVEEQDPLLDAPYRRISIFLNVFDVHV